MEANILTTLKFQLAVPTIKTFLKRYLKAAEADDITMDLANVYLKYIKKLVNILVVS